jgi:transcriptional regulator with XRE-family HTH domain
MAAERSDLPFAEEVKRLIDENEGLTQHRLALAAGIDPGFFARVLQGKKPPSPNVLMRTAKALGLPEEHFREARVQKVIEAMFEDDLIEDDLMVNVLYDQISAMGPRLKKPWPRPWESTPPDPPAE